MPLLWTNRDAADIGEQELPILKGTYRRAFADSAVKLAAGLEASRLLTDSGIPVLFFKGAAMIAMAGGNLGARRIADVDVLIPESDALRAVALLRSAGYSEKAGPPRVRVFHSWTCSDQNGSELDLHWWAFKDAGDDSAMFATSREATLLGNPVRIPSATECLIAAVSHAFPAEGSPMQWIADAMMIFRRDGERIDWAALLDRARRPGLTLPLVDGLGFLAKEFDVPVPDNVIDELRRRPIAWRERAAHWAWNTRPPVGTDALVRLEQHRAFRRHGTGALPRDFVWFLAQSTRVRRRDVVRRAPRRALRSVALLIIRYCTPQRGRPTSRPTVAQCVID